MELEHHLLNATIALPNKTGLTEGRIAELERVLERDCKRLPQTEREWERDDLPRYGYVDERECLGPINSIIQDRLFTKWNADQLTSFPHFTESTLWSP